MKIARLKAVIALFVLLFFACEDQKVDSDGCKVNRICTEEFRSITLEITNQEGEPYILDDFHTFYGSRKKFEFELNEMQKGEGIYPVLTDAEMDEIEREGTTLIFVGEKDGVNVVEHQMVIGHDCCHVVLIEGEDKIII